MFFVGASDPSPKVLVQGQESIVVALLPFGYNHQQTEIEINYSQSGKS
jgi:hypothetical protein